MAEEIISHSLGGPVSLDDFKPASTLTRDDLVRVTPLGPLTQQASSANLAGQIALLGDNLEETYNQVLGELSSEGQSFTMQQRIDSVRQDSFDASQAAMSELLTSADLSIEDKERITRSYLDSVDEQFNSRKALILQAAAEDIPGESVDSSETRMTVAASMSSMFDAHAEQQKIMNGLALGQEGVIDKTIDLFEVIVPAAEQLHFGRFMSKINKDDNSLDKLETLTSTLLFLGSARWEASKMLDGKSPQEVLEITRRVLAVAEAHPNVILPDGNAFLVAHNLRTILEKGYYTKTDLVIENLVSLLDLIGLSALTKPTLNLAKGIGRLTKAYYQGAGYALSLRKATRRALKTNVQPTSNLETLKMANPKKASEIFTAAANDNKTVYANDNGLSMAFSGTTKDDMMFDVLMPEIGTPDGSLRSKLLLTANDNKGGFGGVSREVDDYVSNVGFSHLDDEEINQTISHKLNNFMSAVGVKGRKAMYQYSDDVVNPDGTSKITMVFGPPSGGWLNPQDALDVSFQALRAEGVSRSELKLVMMQGDEYVPYVPGTKNTNFLVKLDVNYSPHITDVEILSDLGVRWNFFDRFNIGTGKSGSIMRHFLDAATMLKGFVTNPLNVMVDRAAGLEAVLLSEARVLLETYKALPTNLVLASGKKVNSQARVERYLKKANYERIDTSNTARLLADGLTLKEIEVIQEFKKVQDTNYWLRNRDYVTSHRSDGYGLFIDESGKGTEIIAKPFKRGAVSEKTRIYDHKTGEFSFLSKEKLDDLYAKGGTVVHMKNPMKIGDDVAEFMIAPNGKNGAFYRPLRNDDILLPYINGYFSISYKDGIIIKETVRDSRGAELYTKAIATAENHEAASLLIRRMESGSKNNSTYSSERANKVSELENAWNVDHSQGMTSQKMRGTRLENANGGPDALHSHIEDPFESMARDWRSLSMRTMAREPLDAYATRIKAKGLADGTLKKDAQGRVHIPNSTKDVVSDLTGKSKEIADMRTIVEHYNSLVRGYNNSWDDMYKHAIRGLMHMFEGIDGVISARIQAGLGKASLIKPTQKVKGSAFIMYLAAHPTRQFIVQGHQAARLFYKFPIYMADPRKASSQYLILLAGMREAVPSKSLLKAAGMSLEEATAMNKQFKRSGLANAVDVNNLTRNDITNLVDITFAQKARTMIGKPLKLAQRIGFDAGEQVNMGMAWLAHRDDALKTFGPNLNQRHLDKVLADARHYTYNMNRAGDMPYNTNLLNIPMQFMQVPHKAALHYVNRTMSVKDRGKSFLLDYLMFGVGPWADKYLDSILPEDPEIREILVRGFEDAALNKLLSLATGEEVDIDFSGSLAPGNIAGLGNQLFKYIDGGLSSFLTESAAGGLVGADGRVTNLVKSVMRYANVMDDVDPNNPTEILAILENFKLLSSGYSAYARAKLALSTGKTYNSRNVEKVGNYTTMEAIMLSFGFRSYEEAKEFDISKEAYEAKAEFTEDVTYHYTEFMKGLDPESTTQEKYVKLMSYAYVAFGNDGKAQKIILSLFKRDFLSSDKLFKSINGAIKWMDHDKRESFYRRVHPLVTTEELQIIKDSYNVIETFEGTY